MSAYTTWDITAFDADGEMIGILPHRAVGSLTHDLDLALAVARVHDPRTMAVEVAPRSSKLPKLEGLVGIIPVDIQRVRRVSAQITLRG